MLKRTFLFLLGCPLLAGCMEGSKPEAERLPRVEQLTTPPKVSLYDRLGREPAIAKVVDDFIVIVVADPNIKDVHKEHFKDEKRVGALKKKLVAQIGQGTGGPQQYTGKDMKEAHKGMKITDADFDALAGDLAEALKKNNVGAKEQKELMDILGSMRTDVVEKSEE